MAQSIEAKVRRVSALAIRPMTRADLDIALDWAAAEGWNPGLHDRDPFFAADPDGFLIGFFGDAPAAVISVVAYGDTYGFLGLYIVAPPFRGEGHGIAIWRAGMDRLGGRTVALDAVVAEQANYARSGFVPMHRTIRYAGVASTHEIADPRVVELRQDRPPGLAGAVIAYDRTIFPAPRAPFLRAWLTPPGRRTVALVADNAIRGYGSVRACREGYKVGPLFADTEESAERIFAALTGRLFGSRVSIDVPEPNAAGITLAARHRLVPVFETARMVRGPALVEPLGRIYGVTSLELG